MMAAATKIKQVQVSTSSTGGETLSAGTLYFNGSASTFRYAADYLNAPDSFDLVPSLLRSLAPFTFEGLGPFSDAAPDRWGRKILERNQNRHSLQESDYLLVVNDMTRQGAIRFWVDGQPAAGEEGVPVLADLAALLNTADAVEENRDVDDVALRRLYRATGSLGGARPKASVFDKGALWVAKFPKPNGDDWDVIGWEAVTLELAAMAGIEVPEHRVIRVKNRQKQERSVLLTKRFDRREAATAEEMQRIPYMSVMTALEAKDGEGGDWMDLVEKARELGADSRQLWKRAVFGAAIGNLDDHLRNHGFIRSAGGWNLSAAFDINPEPYDGPSTDQHQLSLFGDSRVTLSRLLQPESLELFDVQPSEAQAWLPDLRSALAQAIGRARFRHLDTHSVAVMESRFSHALVELGLLI